MLKIFIGLFLIFSVTQSWSSDSYENSNMYSLEQVQTDSENSHHHDNTDSDGEEDEKEFDDDFLEHPATRLALESLNKLEACINNPYKAPFLDSLCRPPRA